MNALVPRAYVGRIGDDGAEVAFLMLRSPHTGGVQPSDKSWRLLVSSKAFWIGLTAGLGPQLLFWLQLMRQAAHSSDEGRLYLSYLAFGPAFVGLFCVLLGVILCLVGGSVRAPGTGLLAGTGVGLIIYAATCQLAGVPSG